MNFYYVAVALVGALSLILLTIGTGMLSTESRKHKSCTKETTARIKELKEKQTGKPGAPGSIRYYPVFEYRANGQFLRVESKVGSDRPAYQVNDEVPIFYNPDNKREFYVPGKSSARIIGAVFTAIGILIALGIAVVTFLFRKQ